MPIIKIHKMTKKINSISRVPTSTWVPSGGHAEINVKLKEKTTEHNPVFLLKGVSLTKLADYNYVTLMDEDGTTPLKYYWVDNKVYITNDLSEWHCHLDVLATYHESILGSEGFCRYADQAHWNPFADDDRLQPDKEIAHINFPAAERPRRDSDSYWQNFNYVNFDQGTFIGYNSPGEWSVLLKCFSSCIDLPHANTHTGLIYYLMPFSSYMELLDDLASNINSITEPLSQGDVGTALKNTLVSVFSGGSPVDCIAAVTLLPIRIDHFDGLDGFTQIQNLDNDYQIYIGSKSYKIPYMRGGQEIKSYIVTAMNILKQDSFQIPLRFPQLMDNFPFLKGPKYTKYTLVHPCGQLDCSDKTLLDQVWLDGYSSIDYLTGSYTVKLNADHRRGARSIIECNGNISEDLWWVANGARTNAAESTLVNASSAALGAALGPIINAGVSTTTITGGDVVKTVIGAEGVDVAGAKGQIREHKEPQTITSEGHTNTGIKGLFPPTQSLSATRESANKGTMMGTALLDTDGTNKYLQFTFNIEAYLPTIFMSDDPNEQGMILDDTGSRYVAFCNQYGWVCNKRLRLGEIFDEDQPTKTSYVQMVGASWVPQTAGSSGANHKHEPAASPADICEVNQFLNSGIYLEK